MTTSPFDYHAPASISDAAELLAKNPDSAKVLAGGHSLIPFMKTRLARPSVIIDLGKIQGLSYIRDNNKGLIIGPMTTYYQLASSGLVQERANALADAAAIVADPQVRNMGTIGGSLAHADPAGDLPAVVVALDAKITASSSSGHRTIDATDFFVDILTTALKPDEILSEITFPAPAKGAVSAYEKFANKASHYAIVGVAASLTLDSSGSCLDAAIGITGAGPASSRAKDAENALKGNTINDSSIKSAAEKAGIGIDFNDDIHASAEYRAHLTKIYTERAIKAAISRAK